MGRYTMFSYVTIATIFACLLSCVYSVDLRTPPVISLPNRPQVQYHQRTREIVLNCTATGNPKPVYSWRFNDKPIPSGGSVSVDSQTGLLTISGYSDREQGRYYCLASNSFTPSTNPTALSPAIDILTVGFGPTEDSATPEPVAGKEGDYAALKCINAPESVPRAKFSWFIEPSPGKSQQVTDDNNRIFVDNKGTLHFIYLETKDQRKDSTNVYKCGMYNDPLQSIQLASPTALTVLPGAKNQVQPSLKYSTKPALFPQTQTAELECVFSGFPKPTIKWYNGIDREIVPDGVKYTYEANGMRLRILDLQEGAEGDTGVYTCKGSNTKGQEEGSVFLQVTSGPIWTQALTYQTIPAGFDATFTCKAKKPFGPEFNPLNTPIWFLNGNELSTLPPDGRMEWSEGKTVLTVKQVQKNIDVMCLQCNVSNEFGYEFDNACLNVVEPIVVERHPAEVQRIRLGDAVDLTVLGRTDPALTLKYRWSFRGEVYEKTLPPHVTYDEQLKSTFINTTGMTDSQLDEISGVYSRFLYHDFQTVVFDIEVVAEHPTAIPVVVEAGFPWWVIVLVIVLLLLVIIVIIIVLCCCRNKDKGDYIVYKKEVNATYLNPDKDIEDNKFHDVARIENEYDGDDSKKPLRLGPNYDLSGDEADSLDAYEGGGRHSHA